MIFWGEMISLCTRIRKLTAFANGYAPAGHPFGRSPKPLRFAERPAGRPAPAHPHLRRGKGQALRKE